MAQDITFPNAATIHARLNEYAKSNMTPAQIQTVSDALQGWVISPAGALLRAERALREGFDPSKAQDAKGLALTAASIAAGPSHGGSLHDAYMEQQAQPPRVPVGEHSPRTASDATAGVEFE